MAARDHLICLNFCCCFENAALVPCCTTHDAVSIRLHATPSMMPTDLSRLLILQKGLKTGMYYLRTRAAADAIKFTVDQQVRACSCRL